MCILVEGRTRVRRVIAASPILAYKQVRVSGFGFFPLVSNRHPESGWRRGTTYRAHTAVRDVTGSRTGFHATRRYRQSMEFGRELAVVRVHLWGRVIEHQHQPGKARLGPAGYRAQFMKIL